MLLPEWDLFFKKYNPAAPFQYKFVDEVHGKKFASEERIGKLSGIFALLAILISCLGIFGLATFVAEQRLREVSILKDTRCFHLQHLAIIVERFLFTDIVLICARSATGLVFHEQLVTGL